MVPRKFEPKAADTRALARVTKTARLLRHAEVGRDAAIVEASSRGIPRRVVAEAAGISYSRVQQIVDAARH
jgi:hypothetical protein